MKHLQIYTAINMVVRMGSIRKAAESLAISPSALNRQILGFEDQLGVKLFERLPDGVRLSTAGEVYFRSFRDHLAEMERARSQVADLSGVRSGSVRLAVTPDLATHFAFNEIAAYRAAFPGVNFSVSVVAYDAGEAALSSMEGDVFLGVQPQFSRGVDVSAFAEDAVVVLAGGEYDRVERIGMEHLLDAPVIASGPRSGLRNLFDAAMAQRRVSPRIAVEADTPAPAMMLRRDRALMLLCAAEAAAMGPPPAGLRILPLQPGLIPRPTIVVAQLAGRALPVAASKFKEQLAQVLG